MKRVQTLILTLILILSIALTGCGEETMNGYTKMTNVEGIDFYVPTMLSNSATAITEISPDNIYDAMNTYTYKDKNGFLIFRMSEMVIAVQKGTNFKLGGCSNSNEKQNALTGNSILGIWFNIPNKFKDNTEKIDGGGTKYTCPVIGEVVITTNLYDNFTGKLAIIETAGMEYSIFAGYKGEVFEDLTKEQQSTVESIVNAFTLSASAQTSDNTQATAEPTSTPVPTEAPTPKPTNTPAPTEVPTPEPTAEPTVTDEPVTGGDEIIIDVPSTTDEPITEPTNTLVPTEAPTPAPTDTPTPTKVPEATQEPIAGTTDKQSIVLDNQSEEENSIYGLQPLNKESNINMLQGYHAINMTITPTTLYTDEDAVEIIKEHCEKEDTLYEYTDAPAGCHWEVIKYTISYQQNDMIIPYLNVKLIGLDGEALKYRGITYSKRTHDILISEKENGGTVTKELYCFYAIPNGCTEYALEMGDGTIHNEEESAYYLIKQ